VANILIVDDDEHLCTCIKDMLSAGGHVCQVAGDGESALRVLAQGGTDLLILDVMIPGMSGFELCRRIHAAPDLYGVPILFLSAMNSEEEVLHGLAQGADDYLTKPFKAEMLRARVDRLLATRSKEQLQDEATGLASPKGIKLEIQRTLTLKQSFGVAYIELVYLHEFARLVGDEGRSRAIRHLARGLQICGEELKSDFFRAGHMGGGHFVCMLEPGQTEPFGERVCRMWERHRPRLYESVGLHMQDPTAARPAPLLETLYCAMIHNGVGKRSAQEIFEVLSHLRDSARNRPGGGVFIDRRG
jgi:DNA-binding response OmpR family regulator